MYGGWQIFSPTLLVEVEGSLLIRWVALYALASVTRRAEREKHTRALALLGGPGGAWRGEVMGVGARRTSCYELPNHGH
jgi:hypothetical protein